MTRYCSSCWLSVAQGLPDRQYHMVITFKKHNLNHQCAQDMQHLSSDGISHYGNNWVH